MDFSSSQISLLEMEWGANGIQLEVLDTTLQLNRVVSLQIYQFSNMSLEE